MTGHAAGYCAGYDEPGFTDAPVGRGFVGRGGRGRRLGGRGHGAFFRGRLHSGRFAEPAAGGPAAPAWTAEDERQALSQQARGLAAALERIKARLSQMEDKTE